MAAALAAALVACGDGGAHTGDGGSTVSTPVPPTHAGGPRQPDAGGKVIEVEMVTDVQHGGANLFRPATFEAKRGDVIRYKLVSGAHDVSFPADSNQSMSSPPPASPMLQAVGQTHDVKVTWEPGRSFFQCDPHALPGMTGLVTVK